MTSLSDYYDLLAKADWTYAMSDDHSVWRRGQAEFGTLERIAKESLEHQKLYDNYKAYAWSEWKTKPDGSPDYDAGPEVPRPEKPMEKTFRTGESNGSA